MNKNNIKNKNDKSVNLIHNHNNIENINNHIYNINIQINHI